MTTVTSTMNPVRASTSHTVTCLLPLSAPSRFGGRPNQLVSKRHVPAGHSETAAHPFPQPAGAPPLSMHPAAHPVSESPELPSAEQQERYGRQQEQHRSQDQRENNQDEAQDEAHDRLDRTQDDHDESNVWGLPPAMSQLHRVMGLIPSGGLSRSSTHEDALPRHS